MRRRSDGWKLTVYNFLERPKALTAVIYHSLLLVLIFGSAILSVISTIDKYETDQVMIFVSHKYEICLLLIFTAEFVMRLTVCSVVGKYAGLAGRLRFMRSFYMIMDAFVITATTATMSYRTDDAAYFTIIRFTRFFQILRILRLDRQRGDLRTMWRVVSEHKRELITCYFFCFIILFLGAYGMYFVEENSDPSSGGIDNMVNGIYWGIITFTSVGYGDYTPQTWPGKILTMLFSIVGCAIFSLPAGIIGSGFALQVSKQKKEKRFYKTRHPAAMLIQAAWRKYALSREDLNATYSYSLSLLFSDRLQSNGRSTSLRDMNNGSKNVVLKTNSLGFEEERRLSNIFRRNKPNKLEDVLQRRRNAGVLCLEDILKERNELASRNVGDCIQLKYKIALQFIATVKFLTEASSFKSSCLPYVNVDEIVQRSNNNIAESLSQLKDINGRLDWIVKELKSLKKDVDEIKKQDRDSSTR